MKKTKCLPNGLFEELDCMLPRIVTIAQKLEVIDNNNERMKDCYDAIYRTVKHADFIKRRILKTDFDDSSRWGFFVTSQGAYTRQGTLRHHLTILTELLYKWHRCWEYIESTYSLMESRRFQIRHIYHSQRKNTRDCFFKALVSYEEAARHTRYYNGKWVEILDQIGEDDNWAFLFLALNEGDYSEETLPIEFAAGERYAQFTNDPSWKQRFYEMEGRQLLKELIEKENARFAQKWQGIGPPRNYNTADPFLYVMQIARVQWFAVYAILALGCVGPVVDALVRNTKYSYAWSPYSENAPDRDASPVRR